MSEEVRRVAVVLNAASGQPGKAAIAAQVADYFTARGIDARIELARTPAGLPNAIERAIGSGAPVVVAGGGDGTIAAVAEALIGAADAAAGPSPALGILPLGTFNYLARRFAVPLELEPALDVIAEGATSTMSVGDANGRIFLNNSGIGLYPAVLRERESAYRRIGRSQAAAYFSVAFVLLQRRGLLDLQLQADGDPMTRQTPMLFVGVNQYQLESFAIPGADCIAAGRLAVCITRPMAAGRLTRVAARAFFRGLYGTDALETVCARELSVTLRRTRVRVALDGEIVRLNTPVRYRIRPDALRLIVPRGSR